MQRLRSQGLLLITRVRITTTARAPFSSLSHKNRRKWGNKIPLRELFRDWPSWQHAHLNIYSLLTPIYYHSLVLHWDSPSEPVLFVLVKMPSGHEMILLSSDTNLTAVEVITAYSWRFKIEVSFRFLVNLLGGFGYHFWSKELPKKWSRIKRAVNLELGEFPERVQIQLQQKMAAYERFVNMNLIALGLLQMLGAEMPELIWKQFRGWFRTYPEHGMPSAQVSRLMLRQIWKERQGKSSPSLLLEQMREEKSRERHPQKQPS